MTTEPTKRDPFSDWRPAAGTRQYCGELELTIPIDRDNYFTITADPDTVAMVPEVLRQLLAQPAGGLVERVANAISEGDEPDKWHPEASDAILEVATWFDRLALHGSGEYAQAAKVLRQEVERG